MTREEWNDRYARRLVEVAEVSEDDAADAARADDASFDRGVPGEQ